MSARPELAGPNGVRERARAIFQAGGLNQALAAGLLPRHVKVSLSEAVVLGLLKQSVRKYIAVFGHGSTDLADVLRVYE
ncbi:MAG: thiamine pyrophosphate-binding protein, partial [Methylocystaceae bacterium]